MQDETTSSGPHPFPEQPWADELDWDDEPFEDAASLDEEPPRPGLPRPLARGCAVVASLILIVSFVTVVVTGFSGSTWTYGRTRVDASTSRRLERLAADLLAAGAPDVAVIHVQVAARPGANIGDAIEALATAEDALAGLQDAQLVALRRLVHDIYVELYQRQNGTRPGPRRLPTPAGQVV